MFKLRHNWNIRLDFQEQYDAIFLLKYKKKKKKKKASVYAGL
jgi:hypothetical protein